MQFFKLIMFRYILVQLIVLTSLISPLITTNINTYKGITCSQAAGEPIYAKAKENCKLYKNETTINEINEIYFIVPESYFVEILSTITTEVLKVKYYGKVGYVKKTSVTEVNFTPKNSTLLGITFDLISPGGTQIRSSPTIPVPPADNSYDIIPAGKTGITFIASTIGDAPTGGGSDVWYYARYMPEPTTVIDGYVYSKRTENLTEIQLNTENPTDPINTEDITSLNQENAPRISQSLKWILIICICTPIIAIFILLLLRRKETIIKSQHEEPLINPSFSEKDYKQKEQPKVTAKTSKPLSKQPRKASFLDFFVEFAEKPVTRKPQDKLSKFIEKTPKPPNDSSNYSSYYSDDELL